MRLLVGLIIIFLNMPGSAQPGSPRQQHGTVNIVLANPQGMVVVTDSLLSSTNSLPGRGQKLFQIDSRTICTIAGWYSSSGPSIDGTHYPAYTAIPPSSDGSSRGTRTWPRFQFKERLKSLAVSYGSAWKQCLRSTWGRATLSVHNQPR